MKILVTGAAGFIGRYVVKEAQARGHFVIAVSRSPLATETVAEPSLRWLHHDLSVADGFTMEGLDVDVVVHLAAALAGSADEQYRDTVLSTQYLIAAMQRAGVRKLIGLSSIAVLDYSRLPAFSLIDEQAPRSIDRDIGIYARMKREQETLMERFLAASDAVGAILRPGLVYDQTTLFAAHAGLLKGSLRLLVSHAGEVPLIEACSLARAILNAVERDLQGGQIINLVDDQLPDMPRYLLALRQRGVLAGGGICVPWRGLAALVGALCAVPGVRHRLPEALQPHGFAARLKPFRYTNDKAKRLLSWVPGHHFA